MEARPKTAETPLASVAEVGRPQLGAVLGARNGPTPLHGQPQPQFKLFHPRLRLKQQALRLATVTGTGEKSSCVRL